MVIRWMYFYSKCIWTSFKKKKNIVSEAPVQTHLCCLKLRSTLDSNTFTSLLLASDHLVFDLLQITVFSATLFTSLLWVSPNASVISIKVNSNTASPPRWLRTVVVHSFLKGDIIKLPEALNFWLRDVWQLTLVNLAFYLSCIFSLFPFHWASAVFWLVYLIIS